MTRTLGCNPRAGGCRRRVSALWRVTVATLRGPARRGLRALQIVGLMLVLTSPASIAIARGDDAAPAPPARSALSAYESVREGNRLLRDGRAEDALKAYDLAEPLAPDAREIPFARGIAQYELGRFDEARQSFQEAALSSNRALAADATYGIGASHHAEALAHSDDPKQVLSHLEQAMSQYRTLLADQPEHAFAREADSKAARMWKQVKQQLQQEQQQQQKPDDQQLNEEQDKPQSEQPQQSNENPESQPEQQQQQQSQDPPAQQPPQQSQQQKSSDSEQSKQDESQQEASQPADGDEQKEQGEEQADSEQRTSREQAERRLREMMQELRDRRKLKGQNVDRPIVAPVEKDW